MRGPTRATPVVLVALAALLLAARVALGVWDAVNPETRPELVTWIAPSEAAGEARSRGRLLLYAFTDRKVPASRKLASEIFASPQYSHQIERTFVPVRIEGGPADDTPETAALRSRFAIRELPTLVVASADGARSKVIPGYAKAGATAEALVTAQLELMGLPGVSRRGFQFRVGSGSTALDSIGANAPGEADSVLNGR